MKPDDHLDAFDHRLLPWLKFFFWLQLLVWLAWFIGYTLEAWG